MTFKIVAAKILFIVSVLDADNHLVGNFSDTITV